MVTGRHIDVYWSPGTKDCLTHPTMNITRQVLVQPTTSVADMRMLRWICGHTRLDRVRNDDIRDRLRVAPIEEKLIQHILRWFGYIHRRPLEAPVHIDTIRWTIMWREVEVDQTWHGRSQSKGTWKNGIYQWSCVWIEVLGKKLPTCPNRD